MDLGRRWHFLLLTSILLCFVLFAHKVICEIDEKNDRCPDRNAFRCKNGDCIDSAKECNGENDCSDRSDELDCDGKKVCGDDEYQCHHSNMCISKQYLCDLHYDCPHEDDEQNCTNSGPFEEIECTKFEFQCLGDHMCLPLEMVCDGVPQCLDGTDESMGCLDIEKSCTGGFLCKNRHCLTNPEWVCDGVDDCGDNSDEEANCISNCLLENRQFLCANKANCIAIDNVCNGKADCEDGSDESHLCQELDKNMDCDCPSEVECRILSTGPTCICRKGYQFNQRKSECEDINECERYGICSQGCMNLNGTYQCVCVGKFKLADDDRTCETVNSHEEPLMLFVTHDAINAIELKSHHQYVVTRSVGQLVGVGYDGKMVYYTDISMHTEKIMRVDKDGRHGETLLSNGVLSAEDIAIDHYTGNIYFTDYGHQHIAVCSNDGRRCKVLMNDNMHRPRGIVLYPQRGQFYWSDWGDKPIIGVANMDGSDPRPFVQKDLTYPNGLALDWPNERLYWLDDKRKMIESIRLDGTDRRQVLKNLNKSPHGIAVFQNSIYWSDKAAKSIEYCDKFTGKHRQTLIRDRKVFDIHIYHSALQNFNKNPCAGHECSHLCLLSANYTYSCACPHDSELGADQRTCKKTKKDLLLAIGMMDRILIQPHNEFGRQDKGNGHILPIFVSEMAYNSLTGEIFVADNVQGAIYAYDVDADSEEKMLRKLLSDLGNVTALAFDHLGNNLYWTDADRSTVEVYNLDTQYRTVISTFMGDQTPVGLAIVSDVGKIFVVLKSFIHTHIDSFDMDGRGQHFHVIEDGIGNGPIQLTVDYDFEHIFYADAENNQIGYIDFDGQMHHTFLPNILRPASVVTLGDNIFWTIEKTARLYYTNKHSLSEFKKVIINVEHEMSTPDRVILLAITPLIHSKHPCKISNGGCSHICVATGMFHSTCLCPLGWTYDNFNRNITCIEDRNCEYRCGSGECIKATSRCNGDRDCIDNSDEESCSGRSVSQKSCHVDEFACTDGKQCVDSWMRCDGNFDCTDKSDEQKCPKEIREGSKCHRDQYQCSTGKCIDVNSLCDGVRDCDDGSDEKDCSKNRKNLCSKDMFTCNNGQCIPKSWVCDHRPDCKDQSDEQNCAPEKCPDGYMQCDHGYCIDKSLSCNGNNDCGDFSDEQNCTPGRDDNDSVCDNDDYGANAKFQCISDRTICLPAAAKCNGTADCPGGEDEVGCEGCSVDEFRCTSGECIRQKFMCDTQIDCKDASDETNCNKTVLSSRVVITCTDNLFDCRDNTCLHWSEVCDGTKDCRDGSDEGKLCDTACSLGHPCEQKCRKAPSGAICDCRDGFKLGKDQASCDDIDECATSDNPCSQICENLVGSYSCSCHADYMLERDKSSCKSTGLTVSHLYTSFTSIWHMNPHLTKIWSTNGSRIVGIDMNIRRKMLYFTVEETDALYEFNMTDGSHTIIENIGNPTLVALDWITDNIYFVDKGDEPKIGICHAGGQVCIDILRLEQRYVVKSLAIDPINRYIFYSTLHRHPLQMMESQIYRANLDGTNPELLLESKSHISALACDYDRDIIYFTDWESSVIWSANYDGSHKTKVLQNDQIQRTLSISLFEGKASVISMGSNVVVKCKLYGNKACDLYKLNVANPGHLITVQESRQRNNLHDLCDKQNCSGICIMKDRWADCVCDYGDIVDTVTPCGSSFKFGAPRFRHSSGDGDSTGTFGGIFATIVLLAVILTIVMGSIYVYKVRTSKTFNISMHFQNPKDTFDAAKVKLGQLPQYVRRTARFSELFAPKSAVDAGQSTQSTPKSSSDDCESIYSSQNELDCFTDDTRRLIP